MYKDHIELHVILCNSKKALHYIAWRSYLSVYDGLTIMVKLAG